LVRQEVRIAVSAVIRSNAKILLLRRSKRDKQNPSRWDLPGGRLEFGENPYEAVKRELKEETSLSADEILLGDIINHQYKGRKVISQTVQILFLTNVIGELDVKLKKTEHTDFKWFDRSELESADLVFKEKLLPALLRFLK
jgi:8-oxo-dGTP diphosphatase